jgi:hypothetical protein
MAEADSKKRKRPNEGIESQFLVGKFGKKTVKELLLKNDPKLIIPKLQQMHGLHTASSNASLRLLAQCGITSRTTHARVFENLFSKLLGRIPTLSQPKLHLLLEETFPYLTQPELAGLPIAVLQAVESIPPKFLKKLAASSVLSQLPLSLKQQAWELNQAPFLEHIHPLLSDFISHALSSLCLFDLNASAKNQELSLQVRARVLENVVSSIGTSAKLITETISFVRSEWRRTNEPMWCVLRSELALALHSRAAEARRPFPPGAGDPAFELASKSLLCIKTGECDKKALDSLVV